MGWFPCECCGVENCFPCSGNASTQYQVVIDDLADVGIYVGCDELNGTYVLDHVGSCVWEAEIDPPIEVFQWFPAAWCEVDAIVLVLGVLGVTVRFEAPSGSVEQCTGYAQWNSAAGEGTLDCLALSDYNVPVDAGKCDMTTPATCLVTTL